MSSDLVTGLVRAAMRHDLDQPSSQQRNAARLRVPEQQCQTDISFSKICLASASDFDWTLQQQEAPAHWAMSQAVPGAGEADCVTILANWNWKVPRQFKTDWASQRSNHLLLNHFHQLLITKKTLADIPSTHEYS